VQERDFLLLDEGWQERGERKQLIVKTKRSVVATAKPTIIRSERAIVL
jgi:hypothetical protein